MVSEGRPSRGPNTRKPRKAGEGRRVPAARTYGSPIVIGEVRGVPQVRWCDIRWSSAGLWKNFLGYKGAYIITADGREVGVIMSVEEYHRLLPVNPSPRRPPKMARIEGVLYREVV